MLGCSDNVECYWEYDTSDPWWYGEKNAGMMIREWWFDAFKELPNRRKTSRGPIKSTAGDPPTPSQPFS